MKSIQLYQLVRSKIMSTRRMLMQLQGRTTRRNDGCPLMHSHASFWSLSLPRDVLSFNNLCVPLFFSTKNQLCVLLLCLQLLMWWGCNEWFCSCLLSTYSCQCYNNHLLLSMHKIFWKVMNWNIMGLSDPAKWTTFSQNWCKWLPYHLFSTVKKGRCWPKFYQTILP
jgi:hypothetical protein